jgi:predicted ATPase
MITSMHVENFKCLRQFDIELGSFNVLIGPNDSGKTVFLQAMRFVSAQARAAFGLTYDLRGLEGVTSDKHAGWQDRLDVEVIIKAGWGADGILPAPWVVTVRWKPLGGLQTDRGNEREIGTVGQARIARKIGVCRYCRLNPTDLKAPSSFDEALTQTGKGFATFLHGFLMADRAAFFEMEKAFYSRFREYKIEIEKVGGGTPSAQIAFRTHDAFDLPASSVSDGALLSLAFLALSWDLSCPDVILVEEPENGVHHAALKSIVDTFRDLVQKKKVQVVMTTHSPYLLDLVEPENVFVFRKDDEGAVTCKKLSQFEDVADMKKHFMTGEIWSSLAERERI